jgi:hypothetical protein
LSLLCDLDSKKALPSKWEAVTVPKLRGETCNGWRLRAASTTLVASVIARHIALAMSRHGEMTLACRRSAQLHPTGRIGRDRGWKSPTHRALASVPYGRAFGVLVLSFAGHCSESAGNAISLPVIRSTEIA